MENKGTGNFYTVNSTGYVFLPDVEVNTCKMIFLPEMQVNTCNPVIQEAEAGLL